MADYAKTARFGGMFGILTYLLAWLLGFFIKSGGQAQATLKFIPTLTEGVKQNIQSGVNTDFASRLLGWVSGISPFDLMGLITVAIAGIIIALVGTFIVDTARNTQFGKWIVKTMLRKIVGIVVIGSLGVTFFVNLLSGNVQLPVLMTTITLTIYFTVVAYIYVGLRSIKALEKLLVSP